MDLLQLLGERIKSRIRAGGYPTVERFAHENDIPKPTLSEILNGRNNPTIKTLARIASGLGITLSELLQDPAIDLWVREKAPKYDPRTRKIRAKSVKKTLPARHKKIAR